MFLCETKSLNLHPQIVTQKKREKKIAPPKKEDRRLAQSAKIGKKEFVGDYWGKKEEKQGWGGFVEFVSHGVAGPWWLGAFVYLQALCEEVFERIN